MTNFKPMLACDWHQDHMKFPCIAQPKVDGVHAVNRDGVMLARTLKEFGNKHIQKLFGDKRLRGFCGELIVGDNPAADDLCRNTTSAVNSYEGEPDYTWILFDYCPNDEVAELNYNVRMLTGLATAEKYGIDFRNIKIKVIQSKTVNNMEELLEFEQEMLELGYEGIIVRDPNKPYKYGRCGKTHMGCWRVKRMIEEEILVEEIVEGFHNNNEALTNELGRTERSTHMENMIPNGMVGSMVGSLIKDVHDPITGELLFSKGLKVKVSAGKMTEDERKFYFANPCKLVGQYVKFKMFPKGVKDKPRFPVFVSIRAKEDVIID